MNLSTLRIYFRRGHGYSWPYRRCQPSVQYYIADEWIHRGGLSFFFMFIIPLVFLMVIYLLCATHSALSTPLELALVTPCITLLWISGVSYGMASVALWEEATAVAYIQFQVLSSEFPSKPSKRYVSSGSVNWCQTFWEGWNIDLSIGWPTQVHCVGLVRIQMPFTTSCLSRRHHLNMDWITPHFILYP